MAKFGLVVEVLASQSFLSLFPTLPLLFSVPVQATHPINWHEEHMVKCKLAGRRPENKLSKGIHIQFPLKLVNHSISFIYAHTHTHTHMFSHTYTHAKFSCHLWVASLTASWENGCGLIQSFTGTALKSLTSLTFHDNSKTQSKSLPKPLHSLCVFL